MNLQRKSLRLQGYDYTQSGAYFVTICTHQQLALFGQVVDGEMVLSRLGALVEHEWLQTPVMRPAVELDAFVVMPNHMHGIIVIHDDDGATRYGHDGMGGNLTHVGFGAPNP